ncbi:hypothetical protein CANMA_000539 [Candida margitis]|uniref:uncharacterized protein n=1 Tax=Candida margitis TaxID=1775924 RepID=UPI00222753C3|nr:uncharacterized protein CANMA_000539 [Candida margitis]KAI5970376.1 hypothetical protein CANMA_000539 [Candida margitis]
MSEEVKTVKPVIEDRVYVGNVDYKATEDELRELFKDLNVTEVEIPFKEIIRGERSFKRRLGFAFVQFGSKEDADKAVADFNGHKFKRLNIFLKKAVPPATPEEKEAKIEAYRAQRKAQEEKKEAVKKEKAETKDSNGVVSPPEGKKSVNTIFVTNLDFKVNAKILKKEFAELNPVWIHVPRNRGRSKGIAFVRFKDEETQKKAVELFDKKDINGREVTVDIAVDTRKGSE